MDPWVRGQAFPLTRHTGLTRLICPTNGGSFDEHQRCATAPLQLAQSAAARMDDAGNGFPVAPSPFGLSFPNLVGSFNGCDMIRVPTCFSFTAFPPRRAAAEWAGQSRNPLSRGTPGLN